MKSLLGEGTASRACTGGGGSDGIHKVVKLVTDYLDKASENVRKDK